jgi:hypothetical protein
MNPSLQGVLRKYHKDAQRSLSKHKSAYAWLADKGLKVHQLREKSAGLLAAGALTSNLLLPGNFGTDIQKFANNVVQNIYANQISGESVRVALAAALSPTLPSKVGPLNESQEKELSVFFKKYLNIDAKAELDGNHIPQTYGYTGEEQHLARFPGDSIGEHDELQYIGMAPGLGAWRHFAPSREAMTNETVEMEKYYVAIQTFNLPNWNTKQPYLKNWYKFRKVLVVNPKNGKAAVAVVGDAGPANWTGKQFGLSPELMHYMGLDIGMKKGEILMFFVDEKGGKVPLGPINYDNISVGV